MASRLRLPAEAPASKQVAEEAAAGKLAVEAVAVSRLVEKGAPDRLVGQALAGTSAAEQAATRALVAGTSGVVGAPGEDTANLTAEMRVARAADIKSLAHVSASTLALLDCCRSLDWSARCPREAGSRCSYNYNNW